jgi:hypothetical protein
MRQGIQGLIVRGAAAVGAAAGAVLASIALPTAVNTVFALLTRDADRVASFAYSVAEPLGLLGAAAAAYGLARWAVQTGAGRALIPWIGGAAAAGMVGAALWVGDADIWTVLAAFIIPGAALLAGRRSATAPAGTRSTPEIPAPPPEAVASQRKTEPVERR